MLKKCLLGIMVLLSIGNTYGFVDVGYPNIQQYFSPTLTGTTAPSINTLSSLGVVTLSSSYYKPRSSSSDYGRAVSFYVPLNNYNNNFMYGKRTGFTWNISLNSGRIFYNLEDLGPIKYNQVNHIFSYFKTGQSRRLIVNGVDVTPTNTNYEQGGPMEFGYITGLELKAVIYYNNYYMPDGALSGYNQYLNVLAGVNQGFVCKDNCILEDLDYFEVCNDLDGCVCSPTNEELELGGYCYPGGLLPIELEENTIGCKPTIFNNTVTYSNNTFLTGCSSLDYNYIGIGYQNILEEDIFVPDDGCFIINDDLVSTSLNTFVGESYLDGTPINLGNVNISLSITENGIRPFGFGGYDPKISFTYSGLNLTLPSFYSTIWSIVDNVDYVAGTYKNLVCYILDPVENLDFYNPVVDNSFIYQDKIEGESKKYHAWIYDDYLYIIGYVSYTNSNTRVLIPFYNKWWLGNVEILREQQQENEINSIDELNNLGPQFAGIFSCDSDGDGKVGVLEVTKCPFTIAFNVVQTSANGMLELGKTFITFTKLGNQTTCEVVDYSGENEMINNLANIEATSQVVLKIRNIFKYGVYLIIIIFIILIALKQD